MPAPPSRRTQTKLRREPRPKPGMTASRCASRASDWWLGRRGPAVAVPLLILALVGQTAFHFREALAVAWPALNPVMARMCAVLGCSVEAPREIADLAISRQISRPIPRIKGFWF